MKKHVVGYVPEDETPEETSTWLVDPEDIVIKDLKQAVRYWGRVKKVRISITVDECKKPQPPSAEPRKEDQISAPAVHRRLPNRTTRP